MTRSGPGPVAPVSVVISTMDRPEFLARCLDALLSGTRVPAEVIVVDQGDPSATARLLEDRRKRAVPLRHVTQQRLGLSASQNAGVATAQCAVVSIIDDDCVPDPRWVEIAVERHGRAAGALLMGGRVLALPATGQRTVPLAERTSTRPALLRPDAMAWDVGTGGNFTVTRESFLAVGGNDERLGTGTPGRAGNDLDLFHRLMRAGVEARYEPDLLVFHERATVDEFRGRCWTYGFGIGVCARLWLASGDRSGWRILPSWLVMRARLLIGDPRTAPYEGRVLLGTLHGLWYGSRLRPRSNVSGQQR